MGRLHLACVPWLCAVRKQNALIGNAFGGKTLRLYDISEVSVLKFGLEKFKGLRLEFKEDQDMPQERPWS